MVYMGGVTYKIREFNRIHVLLNYLTEVPKMKFLSSVLVAMGLLLSMYGCTSMVPSQGTLMPGTYAIDADMATAGYARKSLVHIPEGCLSDQPCPLVVVLHGAFSKAREIEAISGFSDLANRERFIVLYPEGIGLLGFLQHWNAGHCCGKAEKDGIDDVGFLDAAITGVTQRFAVDSKRIFMVGHSNGGMLVYRYAAERTQKLAGIAVVSGTINSKSDDQASFPALPVPQKPLSVCIFHGIEDESIPYAGGTIPEKHKDREFASVAEAVNYWVGANGCANIPRTQNLFNGRVKKTGWQDCAGDARVALYAISKWGHAWPGSSNIAVLDTQTQPFDFDAADIIWKFFNP